MSTELFPDYFEPNIMVTAKYKQTMNLRIINKLHYLIGEIKFKENHVEKYWYNLKYMVKALHGVYHLLYKILKTYGNSAMCSKSDYHNLIYGPRPVTQNMDIFKHLCKFISIQLDFVGHQIKFSLCVNFQNTLTKLLFHLTQFLERVIKYENACTGIFVDGLPVKLEWL